MQCDYFDAGLCRSCTLLDRPYPVQVAGSTPSDGKQAVTVKAAWGSQSVTRLKITWLKAPTVAGVSADFTIQP